VHAQKNAIFVFLGLIGGKNEGNNRLLIAEN
jgi:hypothetical protein